MITQPNIKIMDDFLETTQVVEDTELQCRVENMTQEQAEDAMMECAMRHFEPTLNSLVGSHIGHCTTQRFELLLDRIRRWISVQLDGSGFRKFNPYVRDTIRQNANKRLLRGITIETTGNRRIGILEFIKIHCKQQKLKNKETTMEASNVKKMRDALVNLTWHSESDIQQLEQLAKRAIENDIYGGGMLQELCRAIRYGKAALATPPRNCDVGTPKEQHERFIKFCEEGHECSCCKVRGPFSYSGACILRWADLPFGTKNNEQREMQTCANCGTNHDFCETENRKRYGVCGNWTVKQEGDSDGSK